MPPQSPAKGCYEASKAVAAIMHEHGLPCELEVHPDMGHVFPPAFDQSLQKALQFIMNGERQLRLRGGSEP